MCSKSDNFVLAKQKLMNPVWDVNTQDKVNYKNPANWLSKMITRNSTYNDNIDYDEKQLKIFEEDKQSDEEENFFDGSMYHDYLKMLSKSKKKPDKEKQKKQLASGSVHAYLANRPVQKLNDIQNERQRAKSNLHVSSVLPVSDFKISDDTFINGEKWKDIKKEAMEEDYKHSHHYYELGP